MQRLIVGDTVHDRIVDAHADTRRKPVVPKNEGVAPAERMTLFGDRIELLAGDTGRTAATTASKASATTSPACRIRPI